MKTNDHFSEQVLQETLLAVRQEKRRRRQRRVGLAVCLLLASLAVLFRPSSQEVSGTVAQIADPDQNKGMEHVVIFSTAAAGELRSTVEIFSTRDFPVNVKYIGTDEMDTMLAGIPHGFYETANGKTHFYFWSTALVRLN